MIGVELVKLLRRPRTWISVVLAWVDFFRQPIFWRDIQRGFGIQAVYVVVFLAAAWANFSAKDITS